MGDLDEQLSSYDAHVHDRLVACVSRGTLPTKKDSLKERAPIAGGPRHIQSTPRHISILVGPRSLPNQKNCERKGTTWHYWKTQLVKADGLVYLVGEPLKPPGKPVNPKKNRENWVRKGTNLAFHDLKEERQHHVQAEGTAKGLPAKLLSRLPGVGLRPFGVVECPLPLLLNR